MTYDQFQALVKDSLILLDEKSETEDIDDAEPEEWLTLLLEIVHIEAERENDEE